AYGTRRASSYTRGAGTAASSRSSSGPIRPRSGLSSQRAYASGLSHVAVTSSSSASSALVASSASRNPGTSLASSSTRRRSNSATTSPRRPGAALSTNTLRTTEGHY